MRLSPTIPCRRVRDLTTLAKLFSRFHVIITNNSHFRCVCCDAGVQASGDVERGTYAAKKSKKQGKRKEPSRVCFYLTSSCISLHFISVSCMQTSGTAITDGDDAGHDDESEGDEVVGAVSSKEAMFALTSAVENASSLVRCNPILILILVLNLILMFILKLIWMLASLLISLLFWDHYRHSLIC